jgi:hypothetical protein
VHRQGAVEPPLRLDQIAYDDQGRMRYPRHEDTAPESELARHLDVGAKLLAEAAGPDLSTRPSQVTEDFEHLRWFELPGVCLETT